MGLHVILYNCIFIHGRFNQLILLMFYELKRTVSIYTVTRKMVNYT